MIITVLKSETETTLTESDTKVRPWPGWVCRHVIVFSDNYPVYAETNTLSLSLALVRFQIERDDRCSELASVANDRRWPVGVGGSPQPITALSLTL